MPANDADRAAERENVTGPEPSLVVKCPCGCVYSLHTHTVCPECAEWPSRSVQFRALPEVEP